jgi:hypothetical protein
VWAVEILGLFELFPKNHHHDYHFDLCLEKMAQKLYRVIEKPILKHIIAINLHWLFPGGQLILGEVPDKQKQVHTEKSEHAILKHLESFYPALNSHSFIFFELVFKLTNVH